MKNVDDGKEIVREKIQKAKDEIGDVTKPITKDEVVNGPYDRIIDGAYTFSSYIPVGGKYATAAFDKFKFKERAKKLGNTAFNPFYVSKKIKEYFSKDKNP